MKEFRRNFDSYTFIATPIAAACSPGERSISTVVTVELFTRLDAINFWFHVPLETEKIDETLRTHDAPTSVAPVRRAAKLIPEIERDASREIA